MKIENQIKPEGFSGSTGGKETKKKVAEKGSSFMELLAGRLRDVQDMAGAVQAENDTFQKTSGQTDTAGSGAQEQQCRTEAIGSNADQPSEASGETEASGKVHTAEQPQKQPQEETEAGRFSLGQMRAEMPEWKQAASVQPDTGRVSAMQPGIPYLEMDGAAETKEGILADKVQGTDDPAETTQAASMQAASMQATSMQTMSIEATSMQTTSMQNISVPAISAQEMISVPEEELQTDAMQPGLIEAVETHTEKADQPHQIQFRSGRIAEAGQTQISPMESTQMIQKELSQADQAGQAGNAGREPVAFEAAEQPVPGKEEHIKVLPEPQNKAHNPLPEEAQSGSDTASLKDQVEMLKQMSSRETSRIQEKAGQPEKKTDVEELQKYADEQKLGSSAGLFLSKTDGFQEIQAKTAEGTDPAQVMQQVKAGLTQGLEKGQKEFTIRLKPEGLGEVLVHMESVGGKIAMSIGVTNAQTQKLLNSEMMNLREMLKPFHAEVKEIYQSQPQGFDMASGQQSMFQQRQQLFWNRTNQAAVHTGRRGEEEHPEIETASQIYTPETMRERGFNAYV